MAYYMENSDSRQLSKAITLFEDLTRNRGFGRIEKRIVDLLGSHEFLHAVYCPITDRNNPKDIFTSRLVSLYEAASKPSAMRGLADILSDYSHFGYRRTTAVFLTTLVNLAMADMNSNATDLGSRRDHGDIDEDEYERKLEKLERFQRNISEVLDSAKDIVKRTAKDLSRSSGVPRKICTSALFTVPEPRYLDVYKIGFYLNQLMGNLYGFVNISGDVNFLDSVSWSRFMAEIFGKDRLPEVASLILLETENRISEYEDNPAAVAEVVDSLDDWALTVLDRAPEGQREHMLELYLKRLNGIMGKAGIRIHVNLRLLDDLKFHNLGRTISKYAEKLTEVMERAEMLDNAQPTTEPS